MAPTITVVIPTIGRPTLARTLASLAGQAWAPGDAVLLVGDGGPRLCARELWEQFRLPGQYLETPWQMGSWGHPLREWVQREGLAKTSHRWQMDDDDAAWPGAIQTIRAAITAAPDRPHLFRMDFGRQQWDRPILWDRPELREGFIGTPCLVAPTDARFSQRWPARYGGDYDHIRAVCEAAPAGPVWVPQVVCVCRPHLAAPSALAGRTRKP